MAMLIECVNGSMTSHDVRTDDVAGLQRSISLHNLCLFLHAAVCPPDILPQCPRDTWQESVHQ